MPPKAFFFFMPVCPICQKQNVTMGHVLGHGGEGKAKTITEVEREARRARMAKARKKRWPKSKGKV